MTSRFELVAPVARGLAGSADLRVAVSDDAWAWQPATRTLLVGQRQLENLPLGASMGMVAHEIGHCAISRYLAMAEAHRPPGLLASLWRTLLNALEDPRVEGWMALRFAGAASWLAELHACEIRDDTPLPAHVPLSHAFLLHNIREWWRDWQPESGVAPELRALLEKTHVARRAYARTWPNLEGLQDPAREREVLASATLAMKLAVTVGAALAAQVAREIEDLARKIEASPNLRRNAQDTVSLKDAHLAAIVLDEARRVAAPDALPGIDAMTLAEQMRAVFDDGLTAASRARAASGEGAAGPAQTPEPPRQPRAPRSKAQERNALCARLRTALDRIFPIDQERAWSRGHPTGQRLDLRKAMQLQVDPRAAEQLWQRRTVPTRPDAAVLLLVDLSGSMRHDQRIDAAQQATLVCAEVLRERHIPCAVVGFQDALIPLVDFDEPWSARMAARLEEMADEVYGCRQGGHNVPLHNDDGPCLLEAAERLRQRPEATRLLVVISDGAPSGTRSGPDDLLAAVASLARHRDLALAAIGIGPGTGHVEAFYPDATGDVPVADFPQVLAETVVRRLRRTA